jgi:hypothetical protein
MQLPQPKLVQKLALIVGDRVGLCVYQVQAQV